VCRFRAFSWYSFRVFPAVGKYVVFQGFEKLKVKRGILLSVNLCAE